MKKWIALLLAALLLPATALADETVTANAVAQSGSVHQIIAPFSGVLKPFEWETGDVISEGETLFELETIKVYAPVDGTVRAVFADEGDQAADVLGQYGMLAAIEKEHAMIANLTTDTAYNDPDNRLVHVGETVYLERTNDRDTEYTGRVIAVEGKNYVVELLDGEYDGKVSVEAYRNPDCNTQSCIGSGRIDVAAEVSVASQGRVLNCNVDEGDEVKKGDLLFELASPDAERTVTSATMTAPAEGAVELSVISGMQVYKGQLLGKVHDLTDIEVVASVDEMDLDRLYLGKSITVSFDRYPENEVTGTVAHISRIGMPRQNATYYDVTISLNTDLEILPGMNAVVHLQ